MKKGNRPTTLAFSDNFFNLLPKRNPQRKQHSATTTRLRKNNTEQQKPHQWVLPVCDQHWCLRSTLSTLQAWKKVQSFCEPDNCLFVCCLVWVTCKQCPVAKWVRSQVLQLSVHCTAGLWRCSQDTCDWTEANSVESPRFYLQSTPKKTAVSRHTTCSPLDLGSSWPLQPGSQLRPAGPTYFTRIGDQTFQKCD